MLNVLIICFNCDLSYIFVLFFFSSFHVFFFFFLQKMITYCVNCHPLFKGVLRREDLLQEIAFDEILGATAEDDMVCVCLCVFM